MDIVYPLMNYRSKLQPLKQNRLKLHPAKLNANKIITKWTAIIGIALIVVTASIKTVWSGQVTPFNKDVITWNDTRLNNVQLKKGDKVSRFKRGSTTIVLFGKDVMEWADKLQAESPTTLGMELGQIKN